MSTYEFPDPFDNIHLTKCPISTTLIHNQASRGIHYMESNVALQQHQVNNYFHYNDSLTNQNQEEKMESSFILLKADISSLAEGSPKSGCNDFCTLARYLDNKVKITSSILLHSWNQFMLAWRQNLTFGISPLQLLWDVFHPLEKYFWTLMLIGQSLTETPGKMEYLKVTRLDILDLIQRRNHPWNKRFSIRKLHNVLEITPY